MITAIIVVKKGTGLMIVISKNKEKKNEIAEKAVNDDNFVLCSLMENEKGKSKKEMLF